MPRRFFVILTAFFALLLATFSPIRATAAPQEDANAGIMLTATSGQAFTSLEAYARDCWNKTTLLEGQEVTYYELGLVDLPDPGSYDCWLWAGGLIQQTTTSAGTISKGGALFQGVLIRLPNGNWASPSGIASGLVASGNWPVYFRVSDGAFKGATFYGSYKNTGNITVQDAANFMANLRSFLAAVKNLAITGAVVDNLDVARLNNFETYDADEGGVIDLVEWVQGTALDDCFDDNISMKDVDCVCGACCSCECICGKWGGASCDKTPDACDCHKPGEICTCGDYCCLHKCECGAHLPGEAHSAHKNGKPGCDETDGEDGCDCHETDDPEEKPCTCAKYCCYHTCECEKCADLPAEKHSQHKNGSPTCDETDGEKGGECHETDDPEDKPCTCANYCCYHACECERCASLPAAKHSAHKNGLPTCNGTTGSDGCDCHKNDFPEGEAPTVGRNDTFIENSEFDRHYQRLLDALEQKFNISFFRETFGSFQGDAKLPTYQTPPILGQTGVTIDLNKAAENTTLQMLRGAMVATLYFFTFARIFNSLRKIAG